MKASRSSSLIFHFHTLRIQKDKTQTSQRTQRNKKTLPKSVLSISREGKWSEFVNLGGMDRMGVIKNRRSLGEDKTVHFEKLINQVPHLIDMIPWVLNDFLRRIGCIYGHKMQTI